MRRVLLLSILPALLLLTSGGLLAKEKIKWVPVNHKQFGVEAMAGNLSSCAYRACKKNKKQDFLLADKMKVTVKRKKKGDLQIQVWINKASMKEMSRKLVEQAFEEAIQQCYEIMTDDDEEDE
jgi:hypothetical protein